MSERWPTEYSFADMIKKRTSDTTLDWTIYCFTDHLAQDLINYTFEPSISGSYVIVGLQMSYSEIKKEGIKAP